MYLKLAWRNIWRNKRRSIITITSITFAVLLACVMRSMQLGSYDSMIRNATEFYTGYIQIHQNGYWDEKIIDNSLDYDDDLLATVESTEGVEVAVPRLESFALASYGTQTKGGMIMGVDPEKEDMLTHVKNKIVKGSYLEKEDNAVMLGEGLANYLKIDIGDTIVLISQGYHGANSAGVYPVKGIMKFPVPQQNNMIIYLPLDKAQWFYGDPNKLTSIALVVDHARHVDRILTDIQSKVDTEQLEVMGWREMMPDLLQAIEIDNISGQVMLWVLYAVIGFGMFGTFLMMTQERMYEFGVMMSIGMKRLVMQVIIFLEMGMMSLIAVLIGVGISLPILIYYYHNPVYFGTEYSDAFEQFNMEAAYYFSLEPSLFYNQAYVVFFMALVFGSYPLLVISRLQPVKAMREA